MSPDLHQGVVVHKGGAELIERLQPLWLTLHAHHRSVQPAFNYFSDERSWDIRRACYEEWIQQPDSFILLAEEHSSDVGYAFVLIKPGPDDSWITADRIAELETLSVAPARRGHGIGSILLDQVDRELELLGIGDLFIGTLAANIGAHRLYERRGLRPVMTYYARFAADDSHE